LAIAHSSIETIPQLRRWVRKTDEFHPTRRYDGHS
jgi:hypothetical protein